MAMLAGISLEAAIARVGTRRLGTMQLVSALEGLGYSVYQLQYCDPVGGWREGLRGFGMVRDRSASWRHWYAFEGDRVLDSWYERAPRDWPERWRITRQYSVARTGARA
jgi:hypothetical protein